MKIYLLLPATVLAISAKGQEIRSLKLHFNGFYQTKAHVDKVDNDTTCSYLRFYREGKVISVTSEGKPSDLKKWFNLKMSNPSFGNYSINENRIEFSTTSEQGTVLYTGKVRKLSALVLKVRSEINGYRSKEKYYFVEVPGL